jgi:hypothetical protein
LAPSEARSFVTLSLERFATQMLEPSKATPQGRTPAGNVPRLAPSEARSFVTLSLLKSATQMLEPSKAHHGEKPTKKVLPGSVGSALDRVTETFPSGSENNSGGYGNPATATIPPLNDPRSRCRPAHGKALPAWSVQIVIER